MAKRAWLGWPVYRQLTGADRLGRRADAVASQATRQRKPRVATADSAKSVLALPPGSEIGVLSQRGDWLYALLPNDLRSSIPANSEFCNPLKGRRLRVCKSLITIQAGARPAR